MTDAAAGTDGSRLLVVSGPGGVGKGTVVTALAERSPDLVVSVSATTRAPRPGEEPGTHYHFLDDEAFDALAGADGFLEWARFGGHRYGTPWTSISDALRRGHTVVLEIDVQGALQVRKRFPGAILVFLEPPATEALVERLRRRGVDGRDRIDERLRIAEWELAQADKFDHRIVNDTVDAAVAEIDHILSTPPHRS